MGDLIETPKSYIHAKLEHPFRPINRQYGFQKNRLVGMAETCRVNWLAAHPSPYMARHELR